MEVHRNGWKNCNLKQMEEDAHSIKNVFTNIYYLSSLLLSLLVLVLIFNGRTGRSISNK
jgi:hypothetical protein